MYTVAVIPLRYHKVKTMKSKKGKHKYSLNTLIDIKVFLLFLLSNIGSPLDHTTLIEIVSENTDEIAIDYEECINQLVDSGHLLFDEIDGERYYMISKTGRMVSSELYDSLDEEIRERSIKSAAKYLALSRSGKSIKSSITATEEGRFKVTLSTYDSVGEVMKIDITVASKAEAEKIKSNFDTKPENVYRGVLFATSGRMEYMS